MSYLTVSSYFLHENNLKALYVKFHLENLTCVIVIRSQYMYLLHGVKLQESNKTILSENFIYLALPTLSLSSI